MRRSWSSASSTLSAWRRPGRLTRDSAAVRLDSLWAPCEPAAGLCHIVRRSGQATACMARPIGEPCCRPLCRQPVADSARGRPALSSGGKRRWFPVFAGQHAAWGGCRHLHRTSALTTETVKLQTEPLHLRRCRCWHFRCWARRRLCSGRASHHCGPYRWGYVLPSEICFLRPLPDRPTRRFRLMSCAEPAASGDDVAVARPQCIATACNMGCVRPESHSRISLTALVSCALQLGEVVRSTYGAVYRLKQRMSPDGV